MYVEPTRWLYGRGGGHEGVVDLVGLGAVRCVVLVLLVNDMGLFDDYGSSSKRSTNDPMIIGHFCPADNDTKARVLVAKGGFSRGPRSVSMALKGVPLGILGYDVGGVLTVIPPGLKSKRLAVAVTGQRPIHAVRGFACSFSTMIAALTNDTGNRPKCRSKIKDRTLFFFSTTGTRPTRS